MSVREPTTTRNADFAASASAAAERLEGLVAAKAALRPRYLESLRVFHQAARIGTFLAALRAHLDTDAASAQTAACGAKETSDGELAVRIRQLQAVRDEELGALSTVSERIAATAAELKRGCQRQQRDRTINLGGESAEAEEHRKRFGRPAPRAAGVAPRAKPEDTDEELLALREYNHILNQQLLEMSEKADQLARERTRLHTGKSIETRARAKAEVAAGDAQRRKELRLRAENQAVADLQRQNAALGVVVNALQAQLHAERGVWKPAITLGGEAPETLAIADVPAAGAEAEAAAPADEAPGTAVAAAGGVDDAVAAPEDTVA